MAIRDGTECDQLKKKDVIQLKVKYVIMGSIIVMAVVGYIVYVYLFKGKSSESFTPTQNMRYVKNDERTPDHQQYHHHPARR